MEDVYREYRTKISHGDEYKSHTESRPSYGNNQKNFKTEYSPERHLPVRSEGERIEQQTPKTSKIEPKAEMQNNERLPELQNASTTEFRDTVPEKTEQSDPYRIEKQDDVKEIFDLPKYEDRIEFGQTDAMSKKRPSLYGDRLE